MINTILALMTVAIMAIFSLGLHLVKQSAKDEVIKERTACYERILHIKDSVTVKFYEAPAIEGDASTYYDQKGN